MNTQDIMDMALQLAGLDELSADSGIILPADNIRKVMAGISTETPELLIAVHLKMDLVIGHHPSCSKSGLGMSRMVESQIRDMVKWGVPINKARKAIRERVEEIERIIQGGNYDRIDSAAKLLNMPYLNIHTPADILSQRVVQNTVDTFLEKKSDPVLSDVLDALMQIEEYRLVPKLQQPRIWVGSPDDYAGKVMVSMAGGTSAGVDVMCAYFEAGVGTIICMHEQEETLKKAREQNIGNIIVAGHMASDSIGLNILLNELEHRGIEVIKMSGIVYPEK